MAKPTLYRYLNKAELHIDQFGHPWVKLADGYHAILVSSVYGLRINEESSELKFLAEDEKADVPWPEDQAFSDEVGPDNWG